jgi:anthranilate phosphoribosyltransferase
VLETLGVRLDISPHDVQRGIQEVGIGFMFAPLFHKAMKYAAGPRKELGLRTIFNVLGPLTNPAGASAQVLGVYDLSLTEKIAQVLGRLGTRQAFVVCGEGTFDEISICSPTQISHLKDGQVSSYTISPEDYGLQRASIDSIKGGDALENAQIIRNIMDGQEGPKKDMVLLNAGAAFVASGLDQNLKDGIQRAEETIDSGEAKRKLDQFIEFTNSLNG